MRGVVVVDDVAEQLGGYVREFDAGMEVTNAAIDGFLRLARKTDCADRRAAKMLLSGAERIGIDGQARDGQLTMTLAEMHRVKATRGGLVPWISTHLDVT